MVGTRTPPRPGEITLALYGVLLMDEFLSFQRQVINDTMEALKRGNTRTGWDADPVFLIGTMQPDEQEPSWLPQMFSTVINLDEPVVSQSAARTAHQDPRKPKTERERMADFFFGKPGSLKRRGLAGLGDLPSWRRRR